MKIKYVYTAVLVAAFFYSGFSQTRISPKFGFNFSALNTELDTIDSEGRSGWNAGVDFRIESRNRVFFFHPGVRYQKMTADLRKLDEFSMPGELEEETTINSIKVPLNVGGYLTGEGGILRLHLRGGIVPQFVVGVTERDKFAFDKDRLNTFTLGGNLALGVDFILLTAEFSYEFGFSNFYKDFDGKNRMASINFGFIF
jgi:hypothetical protein